MAVKKSKWDLMPHQVLVMPCGCLDGVATSSVSPCYLHDGAELRLVLHLLLSDSPLDTGQDSGLEEVPPVVMEGPEKEFKQFCLHIRGRALWRHMWNLTFLPEAATQGEQRSCLTLFHSSGS